MVTQTKKSTHSSADPTEGGIFKATVDFYNFREMFGFISIQFWGFRAILMVLVIWARFFKLDWCRNHAKIYSGDRFLDIWEGDNLRGNFVACK